MEKLASVLIMMGWVGMCTVAMAGLLMLTYVIHPYLAFVVAIVPGIPYSYLVYSEAREII